MSLRACSFMHLLVISLSFDGSGGWDFFAVALSLSSSLPRDVSCVASLLLVRQTAQAAQASDDGVACGHRVIRVGTVAAAGAWPRWQDLSHCPLRCERPAWRDLGRCVPCTALCPRSIDQRRSTPRFDCLSWHCPFPATLYLNAVSSPVLSVTSTLGRYS